MDFMDIEESSSTDFELNNNPIDQLDSNTVLTEFADSLKEYKLGESEDPFELINRFKSIAAQQALVENDQGLNSYVHWELEAKLWHLADLLYTFRYSQEPPQFQSSGFSSNLIHQDNYLNAHKSLKEIWLIINWLTGNSNSDENDEDDEIEVPKKQSKWFNTRLAISNKDFELISNSSSTINLIDHLDSDAPLRSGKNIHPKDVASDSYNFRKLYTLIKQHNINGALALCEETQNYTLSLILSGIQDYIDPSLDPDFVDSQEPTGNKHKYIWRRTVYKLSQQLNLDDYERAIYSYLSGDVSFCLKVSDDWEDHLLIYLNNILVNESEKFLISENKISNVDKNLTLAIPKNDLSTVDEVLNVLSKSTNLKVKNESNNSLRMILGSIMVNKAGYIINSSVKILSDIIKGKENSNELTSESYLIRILTHFALFLHIIDPSLVSHKDVTRLIVIYVTRLSLYGLNSLIPVYISYLPEADARESYSFFLSTLYDPEQRIQQLNLAKTYELPLENILKKTVARVFEDTKLFYQPSSTIQIDSSEEVGDIDRRLYKTVEWFFESNKYIDAVHSSIILIRRFLLCGKINALREFGTRNNFKQLIKEADLQDKMLSGERKITDEEKEELLQYDYLIQGLQYIEEWDNSLKTLNGNEKNWRSPQIELSVDKVTKSLYSLALNWFSDLTNSPSKTDSIALIKSNGLVQFNVTKSDLDILHELRSLYIPHIVFELQRILKESRFVNWKYMKDSLALANLVADERYKLYQLFKNSDRMKEFLVKTAELAAIAAERGERGIYDWE